MGAVKPLINRESEYIMEKYLEMIDSELAGKLAQQVKESIKGLDNPADTICGIPRTAYYSEYESNKISAFRKGMSSFKFAPVDELRIFESRITAAKSCMNNDDFKVWLQKYIKCKGWDEKAVMMFIHEYDRSRE